MFNTEDITRTLTMVAPAVNLISNHKARKIAGAGIGVITTGIGIYNAIQDYRTIRQQKKKHIIRVLSSEEIYPHLYEQLRPYLPEPSDVLARGESFWDSDDNRKQRLTYRSADHFSCDIVWDGVPVRVLSTFHEKNTGNSMHTVQQQVLILETTTQSDFDTIKERLHQIYINVVPFAETSSPAGEIFKLGQDMLFYQDSARRYPRPLESVVIEDEPKNRIINHIDTFLDSEYEYSQLNIPYHTGIFLYGPPGTGKTSFISALGSSMNLRTYIVNLKMIDSDHDLNKMAQDITPRSLVVLEDIDTISPKRQGEDKTKISLDGLLNFLDGLNTPHGMITVMTANNPSVLDSALLRPGRVDVSAELNYFSQDMILEFCSQFVSDDETFISRIRDLTENLKAKMTGAELLIPVKESLFLDEDGKKEFMLNYIEERVESAT